MSSSSASWQAPVVKAMPCLTAQQPPLPPSTVSAGRPAIMSKAPPRSTTNSAASQLPPSAATAHPSPTGSPGSFVPPLPRTNGLPCGLGAPKAASTTIQTQSPMVETSAESSGMPRRPPPVACQNTLLPWPPSNECEHCSGLPDLYFRGFADGIRAEREISRRMMELEIENTLLRLRRQMHY
jgi:hypothetical protein